MSLRRRAMAATALVLATLLVTGAGLYGYLLYNPGPDRPALSGHAVRTTLKVGDRDRTYLSYAPASLPRGAPLLVVFHGSFEDGATIRRNTAYEFDALADRHGFAVAYPDGYEQGWNDCRTIAATPARQQDVDDPGFVRALTGDMAARYGVANTKFWAAGYSNGAQMVFRLAAEMPERLAGIAAIAAGLPVPADNRCAPVSAALPAVLMAGTRDPISPFAGGEVTIFGFSARGRVLSADATARTFARVNGLGAEPATRTLPHRDGSDGTAVREQSFHAAGRPPVTLFTIVGGGHVVPTADHRYPRLVGRSTHDLDAPAAIWDFFAAAG